MKKKNGLVEKILAGRGFYILLALALAIAGASAYVQKTGQQIAEINKPPEVYEYPVANIDEEEKAAFEAMTPAPTAEPTAAPTDVPYAAEPVAEAMAEYTAEPVYEDDGAVEEVTYNFVMPCQGDVVAGFSVDNLVYDKTMKDWRTHNGIDIAMDKGGFVCAIGDGTVVQSAMDELMGYTIIIDHGNNLVSVYSGLDGETALKAGETVSMGDLIAQLGEPGMSESEHKHHLHFAVKKDGKYINPQDLFTE